MTILNRIYSAVTGIERAQGIDISRYNKYFRPAEATQPIHYVIQKLTEGTSYTDLLLDELWPGVAQIPVRGGYHYQRSGMSWEAQVLHFLNVAARHDYHFLAVDLEEIGNVYSDTMFADTRRIIDACRRETGKKVILYTNGSTYTLFNAAIKRLYTDAQVWLDALDFWYAWPSLTALNPSLPASRSTWTFWQYRWDGPLVEYGNGIPCDVNYFNGTAEALHQWAGVTTEPEPPPPTGEEGMYIVKSSAYDMSLRNDHSIYGTRLETVPKNTPMIADIIWTWESDGTGHHKDDKWAHVTEVNGQPKNAWVAVVHLGVIYCSVEAMTPPTNEATTIEVVLHDKDAAGNIIATFKGTLTKQ